MFKSIVSSALLCLLCAGTVQGGEIQKIQADWKKFRLYSDMLGGQTDLLSDGHIQSTEIYTLSPEGASLIATPGGESEKKLIRCWIRNEDYSASLRCESPLASVLPNSISEMKWSLDGIYWNELAPDSQSKAAKLLRSPNLFALGANYGFDSALDSDDFDCTLDAAGGESTVVTATGKVGTDESMRRYVAELDPEHLHVLTRLDIHDPDGSLLTCHYSYEFKEGLALLKEIDYGSIQGRLMKLTATLARSEVSGDSQFRLPYFGIPEPASPVNSTRGLSLFLVLVASILLIISFSMRAKREHP